MSLAVSSGLRSGIRSLFPTRHDLTAMVRTPRQDLVAGLTVAVVALPLALGFGVASGMGAAAGLATAIVAGVLAALFGGSNVQVSGPTGAMTVILVPVAHHHGVDGVLTVGLLAGVLVILLALCHAGRYMRFIPAPVIEGFTIGIAGVIALQQLPAVLGVPAADADRVVIVAYHAVRDFVVTPHWPTLAIATSVAATIVVCARLWRRIPLSLAVVAIVTAIAHLADLPVATIGELPATLPAPSLGFLHLNGLTVLLPSAIAVAALAGLESLLSATVADRMSGRDRHEPDRELFGQGLANIITPLFGGVPATAAIARTAVNVRTGARSRLAAIIHALAIALIVFAAAPLVAHIPLAVLAGVLLATAIGMVELATVRAIARSTRSDGAVLALTAIATIAVDLVTAVIAGLVIASALALRKIALAATVDAVPHADRVVSYEITGPLFFGVTSKFLATLERTTAAVVVIQLSRVTTVDATGALRLRDAIGELEKRDVDVRFAGVRPEHHHALTTLNVITPSRTFTTLEAAVALDSVPQS